MKVSTQHKRPTLAIYWASGCGGCEVSLLNLHETFISLADSWEIVFCPCLLDFKYADIASLPERSIDLTLFNGAIRTDENLEMALLLRRISKVLVAYGSCAHEGCVPGLSNLSSAREHLSKIYLESPALDNPKQTIPKTKTVTPWGVQTLPRFHDRVKPLAEVVTVDYLLPGCPPETYSINTMFSELSVPELPPTGTVLGGGGTSTVCKECPRTRTEQPVTHFHRVHEFIPDEQNCLLEQGILCRGIATRAGCGALCPRVNMPCSGCYGAPEGMPDQGAAMISALGALLDPAAEDVATAARELLKQFPDSAGTLYCYSLAASTAGRLR
jgi:F420-non-reducing hydrogenase small subunit